MLYVWTVACFGEHVEEKEVVPNPLLKSLFALLLESMKYGITEDRSFSAKLELSTENNIKC